jgi:hypothetical protein
MKPLCESTEKCFAYHDSGANAGCGFRCGFDFDTLVKLRFRESLNETQRKMYEYLTQSRIRLD